MVTTKSGTVYIKNEPSVKSLEKNEEKMAEQKLNQLVEENEHVLYQVSSVFPFQLFPDKIIIFPTKITVVHKTLFFKNVFPMLIENIKTVIVSRGLIFAAMKFEITGYEENPEVVQYLWPPYAEKAKNIILGLLEAVRKNVKVEKIPPKKALDKLEQIGEVGEKIKTWA